MNEPTFEDQLTNVFHEALKKVKDHTEDGENSLQGPLDMYPHGILQDLAFMVYHKASRAIAYGSHIYPPFNDLSEKELRSIACMRDDLVDIINYAAFLIIGIDGIVEENKCSSPF